MTTKKFYETKEFLQLETEWEQKLKKSGFVDIESKKDRKQNTVQKQNLKINEEHIVYHMKCSLFLQMHKFTSKLDRFILEKHCEGLSAYDIEDLLAENKLKQISRQAISKRLINILAIAEIKPINFSR